MMPVRLVWLCYYLHRSFNIAVQCVKFNGESQRKLFSIFGTIIENWWLSTIFWARSNALTRWLNIFDICFFLWLDYDFGSIIPIIFIIWFRPRFCLTLQKCWSQLWESWVWVKFIHFLSQWHSFSSLLCLLLQVNLFLLNQLNRSTFF